MRRPWVVSVRNGGKKVRPREEGSRQSTGSSLAYLIESRRYKLVKPIPAEHPSWDRDRLRSQNNVGSLTAAKQKAGYKVNGTLLIKNFALGFRASRRRI